MAVTKSELLALTRQVMDAVGSSRWSDALITTVLNSVYDDEWSNLLNAAPYYTFQQLTVSADSNTRIPFSSLNTGTGNAQKLWYRILSVSDGNYLYSQTSFRDVPLATSSTYLPTYPRLYYVAGDYVQLLPLGTVSNAVVAVNYKPTPFNELADTDVLNFPDAQELILANEAGARLLNKGGAEAVAARTLRDEADLYRKSMLDDWRRRTTEPTRMLYPDSKYDWAGG